MDDWKEFERRILEEGNLKSNTYVARLPSEAVQTKSGFIRRKTPFDFAAGIKGKAAFFDAKSTALQRIYITDVLTKKKAIHQFHELEKAREKGSLAGYLIWWKPLNLYSFVHISTIQTLIKDKIKTIDPNTKDVTSQSDAFPIDLEKLIIPRF